FLTPSDDPEMIGRVGSYEIMGVLGRGGFGIVLKGHDRALDRNVAIKVLDPSAASLAAARERFAREARAMAAISHEHVVPVYAVDTHAGLPFFVMEYVAGGSLERRLTREGHFDVVSIVRIGLQMAQALAAAHQQGLVHRDIKPGNVLLDRGIERVRVADFGLARVANDVSSTRSGFLAGTPQYMAPEQVRGESCDAQSDLFSLGSVMYALCTGHAPFRAETVYGVMQRIVNDEPRPIREQNPLVPPWLAGFIGRLMEKDRARRFISAEEVGQILQSELAHLQNPSVVHEPVRPWLPRRRAARKRTIWIATGGGSVIVAAMAAAAIWHGQRPAVPAPMSSSTGTPISSASAGEVARVPLWNADGLTEARKSVDEFDALLHSAEDGAPLDSWMQQVTDLQTDLEAIRSELEQELAPLAANTEPDPAPNVETKSAPTKIPPADVEQP
ncbi:MAG TPA: serine/threonine-protein kinase, partial [Planctomycetaceae bacterium]|nr:serine/threonine-protein kinase [Planctomycetaceae bacterium]